MPTVCSKVAYDKATYLCLLWIKVHGVYKHFESSLKKFANKEMHDFPLFDQRHEVQNK